MSAVKHNKCLFLSLTLLTYSYIHYFADNDSSHVW